MTKSLRLFGAILALCALAILGACATSGVAGGPPVKMTPQQLSQVLCPTIQAEGAILANAGDPKLAAAIAKYKPTVDLVCANFASATAGGWQSVAQTLLADAPALIANSSLPAAEKQKANIALAAAAPLLNLAIALNTPIPATPASAPK